MAYNYSDTSNWLLSDAAGTGKFKVLENDYARLEASAMFDYPAEVVKVLTDAYNPKQEIGGLVCFRPEKIESGRKFTAVEVIFIDNVSDNKESKYLSDAEQLNSAYKQALGKKLIPLAFHTHPTSNGDNNLFMESMNFLQQLNTSIQDRAATRWCFTYNGVQVRLPELLVVYHSKYAFIGMYGGLIAPLCFSKPKDEAIQASVEKTLDAMADWADTPGRKAVAIFTVLGAAFLTFRYPKVVFPIAFGAGTAVPPLIYANRDRHEFFGVTITGVIIHIPKLPDSEIIEHEMAAIEAYKAKKILETPIR